MSQVSKQNNGKFKGMYIVTPRSNDGYKELYARSGTKSIPFGQPMDLTEGDIANLNNQKEAIKGNSAMNNPYELAKARGISIDKAVDLIDRMGDVATEITWLQKYNIQQA